VVIRPTQASVVDYLNLGEVELFDMAGQKLAPASLVFTLGSTLDSYRSSNCNDGNPFTMCHTLLTTPTLAITYPCAGPTSVSKVIVTNRVDCCKDRIVKFTMDFLDATGKADRPSYQFPTPQASYTVTVPGADAPSSPELSSMPGTCEAAPQVIWPVFCTATSVLVLWAGRRLVRHTHDPT
jgi:hypothetical protein